MARVKQIVPIDVEFVEPSSPAEWREEGEILIIEIGTALLAVKKLCILSVANSAMSMAIHIELPSEAVSSSSKIPCYGLGLAFLKETPHQMPHYFLVDFHGAPLFYAESIN